MVKTRLQIQAFCEQLSKLHGDTFNIPVTVNGRLTRTLGRVMLHRTNKVWAPTELQISKQLLETASEDSIIDVIKHEWAHYFVTKSTGEDHKHDHMFKALADRLGCNGTPSTKVERIVEVQSKYEIHCSCCGKVVGTRSRVCDLTKSPEKFTSKCCKAAVKVIQNW